MAITNAEILKTRLAQAEEAYHKLMIGEKEVSVSIGNFGTTTYNQASWTGQLLKATSALLNRKLPWLKAHQSAATGAMQTLSDNIVGTGFRLSAKPDYKALDKTKKWEEE